MGIGVVVQAVERSVWQGNAPDAPTIRAAFDRAMENILGAGDRDTGWLSENERIVRFYETGALRANITSAVNVAVVLDAAAATLLRQSLERVLLDSGTWTVAVTDYNPVVNGAREWWSTGAASRTRTQDTFPELGGRFDAAENPIGPDARDVRNSTVSEGVTEAAGAVARAAGAGALSLGVIAAGAIAVWAAVENRGAISKALRVKSSAA